MIVRLSSMNVDTQFCRNRTGRKGLPRRPVVAIVTLFNTMLMLGLDLKSGSFIRIEILCSELFLNMLFSIMTLFLSVKFKASPNLLLANTEFSMVVEYGCQK